MKSPARPLAAALVGGLMAAACAGGSGSPAGPSGRAVSDMPVLIGGPYTIGGRTYTPSDPAHYDEVGYASFYGEGLAGRPTANGEPFRPNGFSAAHRTLPLPSYLEVTSLESGETVLVRVNDRGPFAGDRIVDLSVGAARRLGIEADGVAPVRVRRVYPPEADKALLRSGSPASPRPGISEQLREALRERLAAGGGIIPAATPPPDTGRIESVEVPPPSPAEPDRQRRPSATASGDYYVQLGAFSNEVNARRLAERARALGSVRIVDSGRLKRVRLGPFADSRAAESALARARGAGFADARVFRDPDQ